jgi:hypothetical protein
MNTRRRRCPNGEVDAPCTSDRRSAPGGVARDAGLATIGYGTSPEAGQRLTEANADSLLLSLADLALRLRARPLPN